MGCCTSTDRKVELLFEKFQIVSLANLHSNNSQNIPVLVCGRIMPVNEVLICPVKERQCIYYETKVSRYESGKGKHSRGKWFLEFTETEWRDFYLYDPQNPQMKLYIPARQNRMIVRGVDDGRAASGKHGSLLQSEQLPNGIQQLLNRHNYKVEGNLLMLKLKKYMNYVEESYDINEQIACLGFIQDGIDAMGQPVKMMHPIQTQSIPESYFQENHWERADINLLKELCKPSSIVSTDDRRLFRGIEIMMPQVIQPPMMQQVTQVPMMPQVVQGVIIQQPPQYQQPVQYQQPPQYPPVQYPPPQYQQPVQYPPQYQPQYQQPVQYPPQYQQPVQGYYPIAQQINGEICQPLEVDCPPPPVMKNT